MPRKIPIGKQFEKIRAEVIATSFKQVDNNPKNPVNWFASNDAFEKERNRRSVELLKLSNGKIEDLANRLSEAEMMIDFYKIVMPMQSKALEINAKGLNSIVERSVSAGIKRNLTKKVNMDKFIEILRKAVKESKKNNISRKEFFRLAKNLEIPRSPEAIQNYWTTIKKENLLLK